MKIRLTDLLLLVVIALLLWFKVVEPNINPQPPVILAGPTQPAQVVQPPAMPTSNAINVASTEWAAAAVATWTAMAEQQPVVMQVTPTPGPSLNEALGETGNPFLGEVQLP